MSETRLIQFYNFRDQIGSTQITTRKRHRKEDEKMSNKTKKEAWRKTLFLGKITITMEQRGKGQV